MKLSEFIYHLAHRSLFIQIIKYNYNKNCFVRLFDGTVGTLIHWKDLPEYADNIVEGIEPEHNFFEVRIYG